MRRVRWELLVLRAKPPFSVAAIGEFAISALLEKIELQAKAQINTVEEVLKRNYEFSHRFSPIETTVNRLIPFEMKRLAVLERQLLREIAMPRKPTTASVGGPSLAVHILRELDSKSQALFRMAKSVKVGETLWWPEAFAGGDRAVAVKPDVFPPSAEPLSAAISAAAFKAGLSNPVHNELVPAIIAHTGRFMDHFNALRSNTRPRAQKRINSWEPRTTPKAISSGDHGTPASGEVGQAEPHTAHTDYTDLSNAR